MSAVASEAVREVRPIDQDVPFRGAHARRRTGHEEEPTPDNLLRGMGNRSGRRQQDGSAGHESGHFPHEKSSRCKDDGLEGPQTG